MFSGMWSEIKLGKKIRIMYRLIISDFITRTDYVHWADLLTLRVLAWLKGLNIFQKNSVSSITNWKLEDKQKILKKSYQSPPEFE